MSNEYRGFQDKVMGDLTQASIAAQGFESGNKGGKHSKLRIRQSCLPELIPNGATLEFVSTQVHRLKFGDIVLVRSEKDFVLRRFVDFEMIRHGAILHVVKTAGPVLENYPDMALVGKVLKVESRGQTYDPLKKETMGERLKNELTCFGTSTPVQRFMWKLQSLGKLMQGKKKAQK